MDAADDYRIVRPAQVADQQELAWLAIERIYQEFRTPSALDERLERLTDDLPITRRMLGVDLVGSRRIEPAHVGCAVAPDGSRRI